jgi:hypothetical protein
MLLDSGQVPVQHGNSGKNPDIQPHGPSRTATFCLTCPEASWESFHGNTGEGGSNDARYIENVQLFLSFH